MLPLCALILYDDSCSLTSLCPCSLKKSPRWKVVNDMTRGLFALLLANKDRLGAKAQAQAANVAKGPMRQPQVNATWIVSGSGDVPAVFQPLQDALDETTGRRGSHAIVELTRPLLMGADFNGDRKRFNERLQQLKDGKVRLLCLFQVYRQQILVTMLLRDEYVSSVCIIGGDMYALTATSDGTATK